MRRLDSFLLIAAASALACCATTSAKRSTDDMQIDVLWQEESPPLAQQRDDAEKQPATAKQAATSKQARAGKPAKAAAQRKARARKTIQRENSVALQTSTYHLTWQGQRIGEARETFHRSASGVRVIRHEEIRIKRGGVPVDSETEIIIFADHNLHASRVELEARAGAVVRKGHALRADDKSWVIALDGEPVRKVSADAVPLELVPYILAQSGQETYNSPVLLAGYGFAVTEMQVDHRGRSGRAILKTEWGDIETRLKMAGDGALLRASTGETGSLRVDAERLKEGFTAPELPGLSTIPLTGKGKILVVENARREPPPALAGQSVSLTSTGWRIQFDAQRAKLSRRVVALASQVDAMLSDSHDAPGAGGGDALELGRGDCTAHAALFVDLAAEQGIEARLVTGFRIDGKQLVRHRWVAVRQGKDWVQVDPTFNEAPVKPGQHLALAIHGDSTAQIALVDEAVFRGLARASAKWEELTVAGR